MEKRDDMMKLLKDALHNCKRLKISDNHPTLIKDGIINTGNGSRPVSSQSISEACPAKETA